MISPAGYVPLSKLVADWEAQNHGTVLHTCSASCASVRLIGGDDEERAEFFALSPADYSESDVFEAVADHLYLSSVAGHIKKLDGPLFRSLNLELDLNVLEIYSRLAGQDPRGTPLGREIWSTQSLFSMVPDVYWKRLESERVEDPEITPWELAVDLHLARLHHAVPLFFERAGYSISLQGFRYATRIGFPLGQSIKQVAKLLRPFEGWALCSPEVHVASTEYSELLMYGQLTTQPLHTPNSGGRPPDLMNEYLAAYRERYPKGHGRDRTVDQIWTELISATGMEGSRSTVKRVITKARGLLKSS